MTTTETQQQTKAQVQHARLLKKFHTLCTKKGLTDEDKEAILEGFGKTSSREMSNLELAAACGALECNRKQPTGEKLDRMVNGGETSKFRQAKRTIAVLCKYFEKSDYKYSDPVAAAKGMVCRIVGTDNFNRVGEDRLRSIYNAFSKRLKDMDRVKVTHDFGAIVSEN